VPITRTVVLQGSQAIPADWHYEWWFTTTRAGTVDITVDWTYADSTVWVRLGQGKQCSTDWRWGVRLEVASSTAVLALLSVTSSADPMRAPGKATAGLEAATIVETQLSHGRPVPVEA